MPFSIRFCKACLLPADSSVLSPRSSSSIKSILRRHFMKKRSTIIKNDHCTKESNVVHKVKSKHKSHSKLKTTNNYDMTILHDDELNNTRLATVRRRKKNIPSWANKEQLELAIINQVYFQDKTPEEIFGNIRIEDVFNLMNSMDTQNKESSSVIVARHFV